MTHPETLGTLRSGTISWLEVGRESAGSEATKQKCDLVRIKKLRAQGGTEGRVGGQMKDIDRHIQRLKKSNGSFLCQFHICCCTDLVSWKSHWSSFFP